MGQANKIETYLASMGRRDKTALAKRMSVGISTVYMWQRAPLTIRLKHAKLLVAIMRESGIDTTLDALAE